MLTSPLIYIFKHFKARDKFNPQKNQLNLTNKYQNHRQEKQSQINYHHKNDKISNFNHNFSKTINDFD